MPSAKKYAPKVPKEQQWLPMLASQISVQIPKSIAFGQPSNNYP
jgi:hypothetical protein